MPEGCKIIKGNGCDDLDRRVLDPDVGTTRTGEGTQMRVSMTVDTEDRFVAAEVALTALRNAFDAAVPKVAGMRGLAFSAA